MAGRSISAALLPYILAWSTQDHLGNAIGGVLAYANRESIGRKVTLFGNLLRRWWDRRLLPGADDEQDDMIAGVFRAVIVNAEEFGFAVQYNASFLLEFASERGFDRLAELNAAAREMPSGAVAVSDEEDTIIGR